MTPPSNGKKPVAKNLSKAVVDAEATRLLQALSGEDIDPASEGRSLAERFSPLQRRDIVAQLALKLTARSVGFSGDRLYAMLRELAKDTNSGSIGKVVGALLACSMALPGDTKATGQLIDDLLFDRLPGATVPLDSLQQVGRIKGIGPALVAAAQSTVGRGDLGGPAPLLRLNQCLLPLLGYGTGTAALAAADAARLVSSLESIDRSKLPVELHLTIDRLRGMSAQDNSGRRPDRNAAEQPAPRPPETEPHVAQPYTEIVALVRKAAATHERELADSRRIVLRLESEVERLHAGLEAARRSTAEQVDRLSQENTSLKVEAATLAQSLQRLEEKLATTAEQAAIWEQAAELSRREGAMLVGQQEEEVLGRVASALAKPTASLTERITALLTDRPGDNSIRLMAATFDNLHARIQKFTGGTERDRIPPELLRDRRGGE